MNVVPELPEVETVRRGLEQAMVGRTITNVILRRENLRFPFPENLVATLIDRRVDSIRRRAKYLLIDLDDGHVILSHLGMSGRYTLFDAKKVHQYTTSDDSDEDGDGASDPDPTGINGSVWTVTDGADAFLGDSTQWSDGDGDGYGDNPPPATDGDACNTTLGTSYHDRFGCIDSDSDGYSDPDPTGLNGPVWTVADGADAFPSEVSQWADQDGDGYGDNASGVDADNCPTTFGTSANLAIRCSDLDSDGCRFR